MPAPFAEILETLAQGKDLTREQAHEAFTVLMSGTLTPCQAGAFLMGLRAKGETATELAAGVQAILARSVLVDGVPAPSIDVVGTGGDGRGSFNCSTSVAITLAAMGHTVAKHGNRAVSSTSGSADVVEGLGLGLADGPEKVRAQLAATNFSFMFAPYFHPAFKNIMPVRMELGIRTLFNLMGPLLNPASPTHQLLGVARPEILELVAEVLALKGIRRAAVVYGAGGFDELTTFGPAKVAWVENGSVAMTELDPAELGFEPHDPADVVVKDKAQAVEIVRELLAGRGPAAMRDMLILNLAMALHLLEDGLGLPQAVEKARDAVADGVGMAVVNKANGA
ncbi:MAG: anthranilate phosphoribosyltransferase [Desulfovibrionaceae bacterium]|jgi:anthranilate phosphoribosyltransferase/anthranilate synthase/phosphoribosyltransferase|nr:anthranilate phosphoribosyltransferase [Desulfovibrionaceae bacterium]